MTQTSEHRHGPGDPETRKNVLNQLRRIEGQIRGLQRMVGEDRYCPDILVQVSAVHEALRKVSQVLLKNHLGHCVTSAIQSGDEHRAQSIYDELSDLFNKYAR
jgi:DNA-binding FrmR family transcriptional regulator